MTPEPIFGILLSELSEWEKENLCWSEVQDLQRRIRARGPVHPNTPSPEPRDLHPFRCETCIIAGCNERTNATVDFISDIRKQNIIQEFIAKHGCASHSGAQQQAPESFTEDEIRRAMDISKIPPPIEEVDDLLFGTLRKLAKNRVSQQQALAQKQKRGKKE